MIIPVNCPHCGRSLPLPTKVKGRLARCPVCREVFHVPRIWLPMSMFSNQNSPARAGNRSGLGAFVKAITAAGLVGVCGLGVVALLLFAIRQTANRRADPTTFEEANLIATDSHAKALADAYIRQRGLDNASRGTPTGLGDVTEWRPIERNEPLENLADLVELVEPSVVQIITLRADRKGIASGFVVHASGIVVTNYHVVQNVEFAQVEFYDGRTAIVDGFLALAPEKDLAVLKLSPTAGSLPSLSLAPETPRKGEDVAAIGAPMDFSFTMSKGIVSGLRSPAEMRSAGILTNVRWIQTDASTSEGNSGGPLVNMRGEVVGVMTVTSQGNVQNLNFAIAVDAVREVLKQANGPPIPLGRTRKE